MRRENIFLKRGVPLICTGKTDDALELASYLESKGIEAEIINVDSKGVYKYLKALCAIPERKHHLVEFLPPDKRISAVFFAKLMNYCLYSMFNKGIFPILCGGTGFYFEVFFYGVDNIPADGELRNLISVALEDDELRFKIWRYLKKVYEYQIHFNDKKRLSRWIENYVLVGSKVRKKRFMSLFFPVFFHKRIDFDERLKERYKTRYLKMLEEGALEEVKFVVENYGVDAPACYDVISFDDTYDILLGKIDEEKAAFNYSKKAWRFAKKQERWFNRYERYAQQERCYYQRYGNVKELFEVADKILDFYRDTELL